MTLNPAMDRFVDYFAALGPRWGLAADTCRAHALLYLVGKPMAAAEVAAALGLDEAAATAALEDVVTWGMGRRSANGRWDASGEPWDLMFAGLEERRRRELGPALETMRACRAEADAATPAAVRLRIERMLRLVEDLAAIDVQSRRLGPTSVARMVGMGARAARLIDRFFPAPGDRRGR